MRLLSHTPFSSTMVSSQPQMGFRISMQIVAMMRSIFTLPMQRIAATFMKDRMEVCVGFPLSFFPRASETKTEAVVPSAKKVYRNISFGCVVMETADTAAKPSGEIIRVSMVVITTEISLSSTAGTAILIISFLSSGIFLMGHSLVIDVFAG